MWDTHSHILDNLLSSNDHIPPFEYISYVENFADCTLGELLDSFPKNEIKSCVMTTHPKDWKYVINMFKKNPDHVLPALGLHPWIVQQYRNVIDERVLQHLLIVARQYLQKYPSAIIGEIGLDQTEKRLLSFENNTSKILDVKDTTGSLIETQFLVFKAFWNLACEFNRPISLHCVKSDSLILDFLSKQLELVKSTVHETNKFFPFSLAFHSYTGSDEFIRQLYSLKFPPSFHIYVGISKVITSRLPKSRLFKLLGAIPINRMLIESDESNIDMVIPGLNWCIDTIITHKSSKAMDESISIESPRDSIMNQLDANSNAFLNTSS